MGRVLAAAFAPARQVFAEVDDALSQHLSKLMFEGPETDLTLTENAQPALMAARIAALLMPPTLAIIVAAFTDMRERNTAIGVWAAVGALALALGPVVGGLISQHLHWGWIFLINVPVGVITFAIAVFYVDESRAGSAVRQLDLPGLVTSALSLFALTYALIEGSVSGWTAPLILGAFAVAAVAAVAFLAVEARTAHPMVDLSMFRRREFSGGSGTMMIWAFGILGIYFFTSLYLQQTLGFSPVKAGLAFVPMALCVALFAGLAPRVEAWAGVHRTVAFGMLLMVAGLVLFARLGLDVSYVGLLPGFMLFGAGAGYSQLDKLRATFGPDIDNFCNIDPVPAQLLNPASLAPGMGDLIKIMIERYKAKTNANDVPPHCSMGFNQTWVLLNNVLPVAKEKYGGFDPEAIRKAALDVDIPPGGTIQGYGVKFFPPGTPLSGQNERSTPVVMQNAGEHISVVWPTNIRTQDPVFPLPKSSIYAA